MELSMVPVWGDIDDLVVTILPTKNIIFCKEDLSARYTLFTSIWIGYAHRLNTVNKLGRRTDTDGRKDDSNKNYKYPLLLGDIIEM